MNSISTRVSMLQVNAVKIIQVCGFKHFGPPEKYDHVEFPERPRLRVVERQPQLPPNIRAPKMQKKLRLMRGEEKVHNYLLHKQYGIMVSHEATSSPHFSRE
nr:unnamed protein product [Callosobruchus chinensis]